MELTLSEQERKLLLELLESDMSELRVEVRRTEDSTYRARLQEDEACLRQLIERVQTLRA